MPLDFKFFQLNPVAINADTVLIYITMCASGGQLWIPLPSPHKHLTLYGALKISFTVYKTLVIHTLVHLTGQNSTSHTYFSKMKY